MNCPRCREALTLQRIKGRNTEVDACPRCRGVWMDEGELAGTIGARATSPLQIPADARTVENALCPRCAQPLVIFNYPGTITVVDACRHCRGTWLDAGELREIRLARTGGQMRCPNCQKEQPAAATCIHCGVVIEKASAPRRRLERPAARPGSTPDGLKQKLLELVDETLSRLWGGIRG